jgi:large subunit ribosomal protein L6e
MPKQTKTTTAAKGEKKVRPAFENPFIAKGLRKYSRRASYKKKGLWKKKEKGLWKKHQPNLKDKVEQKVKEFGKKKEKRVIEKKIPRIFPVDRKPRKRVSTRPTKVRKSLEPGKVVILLAGRFAAKRVVLLKVLKSGLLVVTGPFKINGVPLKRVNPAYVISTSTKIDISGVKVPEHIDDDYFRRHRAEKKKKTSEEFFAKKEEKPKKESKVVEDKRKEDQKSVDEQVLKSIKSVPLLKKYLNARFTLSNNQAPHLLKF